jgi:hypothetical protein
MDLPQQQASMSRAEYLAWEDQQPGGDWLLAASESSQGLILKSLDFAAGLDTVFEDI